MREKNPKRVAAGRVNGIKSGEARRATSPRLSCAQRRRLRGLCVDCGKNRPRGGKARCTKCAVKNCERTKAAYWADPEPKREYSSVRYHILFPEAGYRGPRVVGRTRADARRELRHRRLAAGHCPDCGGEMSEAAWRRKSKRCDRCFAKRAALDRAYAQRHDRREYLRAYRARQKAVKDAA